MDKPSPARLGGAAEEPEGARTIRTGLLLVAAAAALVTLGELYGYLRALLAVGMFVLIAVAGIRFVRQMVISPPDPEVTDVSEYGLRYVCDVCGLELRVERAAQEAAPRHCTEPMRLVTEGGTPPLRPL